MSSIGQCPLEADHAVRARRALLRTDRGNPYSSCYARDARRQEGIGAAADSRGLGADAGLVTSGVNVRYLTGLVSSNAAVLLPADGPAMLATDSRYAGTAERECPDTGIVIERDVAPALVKLALAGGLHTIAFEDQE